MFNALINKTHIKSIKNDLLNHNRNLKLCTSTQLTEALAFGFGFNTHAALLARFKRDQSAACLALDEARLWARMSALTDLPVEILQEAIEINLSESFSRAIGIRDMRGRLALPGDMEKNMERFSKLMARHGAAYFTIEGMRLSSSSIIPFGGYRPGRYAMRKCFLPTRTPWQWTEKSLSSLMAEDFLEDFVGSGEDPLDWAVTVIQLMEHDVKMGNVVFDVETGFTVHHDEIDGCTASVIYQRAGQLEEIRAADLERSGMDAVSA